MCLIFVHLNSPSTLLAILGPGYSGVQKIQWFIFDFTRNSSFILKAGHNLVSIAPKLFVSGGVVETETSHAKPGQLGTGVTALLPYPKSKYKAAVGLRH